MTASAEADVVMTDEDDGFKADLGLAVSSDEGSESDGSGTEEESDYADDQ